MKQFIILITICIMSSCAHGNESQSSEIETAPVNDKVEIIEMVVDDSTKEILGEKVNEVGDYYIINPQSEEIVPKEGHSVITVTR